MKIETEEAISSIHLWTLKRQQSARLARNNAKSEPERIMLCGKVKAYTDILCLIQDKYGNKIKFPARNQPRS